MILLRLHPLIEEFLQGIGNGGHCHLDTWQDTDPNPDKISLRAPLNLL